LWKWNSNFRLQLHHTKIFGSSFGRVARSLEIFSRTICFSMRYRELLSWVSAGVEERAFSPLLGIGTKKQLSL